MPGDPFQIDILPDAPLARAAFIVARPLLERVLALSAYRALYRNAQGMLDEPFESRALRALDIHAEVSAADLDYIPRSGPVIVAANHPHGIIDGLILMSALRRVRPDIRVLTNQLLARIPELRDCCLFVDPFDGPSAEARSRAGLRAAHMWLRGGGALIVFPAGEVAHARRAGGERADSAWKPAMSRLAVATGAPVDSGVHPRRQQSDVLCRRARSSRAPDAAAAARSAEEARAHDRAASWRAVAAGGLGEEPRRVCGRCPIRGRHTRCEGPAEAGHYRSIPEPARNPPPLEEREHVVSGSSRSDSHQTAVVSDVTSVVTPIATTQRRR